MIRCLSFHLLAGANEDAAVSEKSMPLLVGRWQQDTCDQKAGNPGLEDPPPLSPSCLPQAVGKENPSQTAESHSFMEGTLSDCQRVDRTAVQTVRLARF